MKNKYAIQSGNYSFILEFSSSPEQPLRRNSGTIEVENTHESGVEKSKYLEILIYRSDGSTPNYHARHVKGSQETIPFNIQFPDDHNIHGTLSFFQNEISGQHHIWADIHSGPPKDEHIFIGTLSPLMQVDPSD